MCSKYSGSHGWGGHRKGCHHGHGRREKWAKMRRFKEGWFSPPVNIQEWDDRYELFLYAPGLVKSDFNISVVNRVLRIVVDKKESEAEDAFDWRRKEYRPEEFRREFELNSGIDTAGINALYTEGVLKLTLPKLEDFQSTRQEITIM